jgi:valyl-tRNA synthetase
VLGGVLDALLRLLHPAVPFITEVLWTELTGGESVVIAPWPASDPDRRDVAAEAGIDQVRAVVTEVRRFQSEQGLRPGQRVPARLTGLSPDREASVRGLLRLGEPGAEFVPTATLTTSGGGVEVALDTSGTIDVAAERARLGKDRAAAVKEQEQAHKKLDNDAFLDKAPDHIVAGIRARLAAADAEIVRIDAALAALPAG